MPNTTLRFTGSLNIRIPINTLVIGSVVLNMDAFCAPTMINPFWNKDTPPIVIHIENSNKANQVIGSNLKTKVPKAILYIVPNVYIYFLSFIILYHNCEIIPIFYRIIEYVF